MQQQDFSPEELLGPLNEVEQKFAPERLFVAGKTDYLHRSARVSIVGSRKASPEGLLRAKKLAGLLVERDVVVVSGLAAGIDTAAHRTAIERGGRTIAVIGTPLNRTYPRTNASLQKIIMTEHLCVSQFPPGYPTKPGCFPMRNRTMALLSDATVIIEASDTSGSLSQGWEALRLGRGLFITSAIALDKRVTWTEEFLHYGARVLSNDTVDELFDLLPPRHSTSFDASVSL